MFMESIKNLILVRHGESEGNAVRKSEKFGPISTLQQEAILNRPDWQQRLTPRGRAQAGLARRAIINSYGSIENIDAFYVSPHVRTRETAAIISMGTQATWQIKNALSERSWGSQAKLNNDEISVLNGYVSPNEDWNVCFKRGESFMDIVYRTQNLMDEIYATSQNTALIVAHEGVIDAIRYSIEGLLPEQWVSLKESGENSIRNGSVLQYTNINPEDSTDKRQNFTWARMHYPDKDTHQSPNNGKWKDISSSQLNSDDLLDTVLKFKHIIDK